MTRRQFRILYRNFLFSIVDREVLSAHSSGDSSRLLLQLVTLLLFVSVGFCLPLFALPAARTPAARLALLWTLEHFLIATTMLCIGVLAVLSWDAMFPGRRDMLVLGPLPVPAHTIMFARVSAVVTALAVAVVALHVPAGVAWPMALGGARAVFAYWFTMAAASAFVFGLAAATQGLAAALLPRRLFLRASPLLQLGLFVSIVCVYFLQPMAVRPDVTSSSSPSIWFLGMFQQLSGAGGGAPLAARAWVALTVVLMAAAITYALSYLRIIRGIAEEPEAVVSRHTPASQGGAETAIATFGVRTAARSAQHRVIVAFYWGIAFALAVVFLKSPRGKQVVDVSLSGDWRGTAIPIIVTTLVTMALATVAARLAFALPKELSANWIFRVIPLTEPRRYVSARRRAVARLSIVPVWLASAVLLLAIWPWRIAIEHLVVLLLVGAIAVEACVFGAATVPCASSYLPGRSKAHVSIFVAVVLLLPGIFWLAAVERDALQTPERYAATVAILCGGWYATRRVGTVLTSQNAPPVFESEPEDRVVTVALWDAPSRSRQ